MTKAVLGYLGAALVVVALCIGGWQLHWYLAKSAVGHQYDVNTGTQQYQAGLIAHARDLALDFGRATDPAQKQAIADQFCQTYPNIQPAPADLVAADGRICF